MTARQWRTDAADYPERGGKTDFAPSFAAFFYFRAAQFFWRPRTEDKRTLRNPRREARGESPRHTRNIRKGYSKKRSATGI